MALISELLANIILLVTRPFSLLKLACLFGVRTALLFIYTWTKLVKTTIIFHINIILGIISWTFGLISLPARVMNAFQRERQVSFHSVVVFVLIYEMCPLHNPIHLAVNYVMTGLQLQVLVST